MLIPEMRDNRLEIPLTAAVKRRTGRGNKRPGADQETNQPGCPISSPGRPKGEGALRTKTVANLGTANGRLCLASGARRGGTPIGVPGGPGSGTAWPRKFQMRPLAQLLRENTRRWSPVAGYCTACQRVTWCCSICRAAALPAPRRRRRRPAESDHDPRRSPGWSRARHTHDSTASGQRKARPWPRKCDHHFCGVIPT